MNTTTVSSLELRKFGFIMAFILAIVFGLAWPLWKIQPISMPCNLIGGAFFLLALFTPSLLKPIYSAWMKVGHILGFINTRIILGILYFVIITPIGFIRRLSRHDVMGKKYDPSLTSYRKEVPPSSIDHMERPF